MITEIREQKLVVISDMHLGNPFSKAKGPSVDFFHWAAREGYDIVINGDGFEIAQVSFSKIARDVPEVFHAIKSFTSRGRTVYYVIGNHDIVLENFLNDWGGFKMAPFLNVWSGAKRIRIEHGHLYDPFFVRNPDLYEFVTWLAGFALKLHPSIYKAWIGFEKLKSKYLWKKTAVGIVGENPAFREAAIELAARGFDTVVFGHTHHAGSAPLPNGGVYYNTGSWLMGTPFLLIDGDRIELLRFQRNGVTSLIAAPSAASAPAPSSDSGKTRIADMENAV